MDCKKRTHKQAFTPKLLIACIVGLISLTGILTGCNFPTRSSSDNAVQSSNNVVTAINIPVTIDITSRALEKRLAASSENIIVSIEASPTNGSVQILGDNKVVYTPKSDYFGQDTFVYKLSDLNGPFEIGTVSIGIMCDYCTPQEKVVTLSWSPIPDNSLIYMVYFGKSATEATAIASETSASHVELDVVADLGANPGDTLCFRLRARNNSGISGFSAPVCMVV